MIVHRRPDVHGVPTVLCVLVRPVERQERKMKVNLCRKTARDDVLVVKGKYDSKG